MTNPKLARRYARAFYDASRDAGVTAESMDTVEHSLIPLLDDRTFRTWWFSRRIPVPVKHLQIDHILSGAPAVFRQFLKLLLDKKREFLLDDLVVSLREIDDEERNIVRASLTTAVELKDEELQPFRDMLADVAGGEAVLTTKVDPSLIAGFRLRYGNRIIDGSVARSLDNLRRRLSA